MAERNVIVNDQVPLGVTNLFVRHPLSKGQEIGQNSF